jgi:hypothetical protein
MLIPGSSIQRDFLDHRISRIRSSALFCSRTPNPFSFRNSIIRRSIHSQYPFLTSPTQSPLTFCPYVSTTSPTPKRMFAVPIKALMRPRRTQVSLTIIQFPRLACNHIPRAVVAVTAHVDFATRRRALVFEHVVIAVAPFVSAWVVAGVDVVLAGSESWWVGRGEGVEWRFGGESVRGSV